jgi:hypothetical protein
MSEISSTLQGGSIRIKTNLEEFEDGFYFSLFIL